MMPGAVIEMTATGTHRHLGRASPVFDTLCYHHDSSSAGTKWSGSNACRTAMAPPALTYIGLKGVGDYLRVKRAVDSGQKWPTMGRLYTGDYMDGLV